MPNSHQRWWIIIGVIIATVALAFQSFRSQSRVVADNIPQVPIDPLALTGEFDPSQLAGTFLGQSVWSPPEASYTHPPTQVLGDSDTPKRIEVDLTSQKLYAYEGDQKVYEFLVSTGKWGRTPTGTFKIWGKFRATKMEGGSKERNTYYYLPNVPYVMFFSNDEIAASRGFSIHGTYWHSNFGTPMSHGCVNMKTEEAELLYYWANPDVGDKRSIRASDENPGTEVVIYGTAPST